MENLALTEIRFLYLPTCSEAIHRLRYPGQHYVLVCNILYQLQELQCIETGNDTDDDSFRIVVYSDSSQLWCVNQDFARMYWRLTIDHLQPKEPTFEPIVNSVSYSNTKTWRFYRRSEKGLALTCFPKCRSSVQHTWLPLLLPWDKYGSRISLYLTISASEKAFGIY
jgi:hypothetical protein